MTAKRPWLAIHWDGRSDQPARIRDPVARRRLRATAAADHLLTAATAALHAPLWLAAYALARARPRPVAELLGVAISPFPADPAALRGLVGELGLPRLQIRLPLWDRAAQAAVLATIADFPDHDLLVVLPQDRRAVCDHRGFRAELRHLLERLPPQVGTLQVGNAVNRLKWGCAHLGEYLPLLAIASEELGDRRDLQLAGSAVIDFEPLATLRSLVHRQPIRCDICSALLYVDRRGAPEAKQYGLFDTARKLRCIAAALRLSRRCRQRLWLTEVNWPLAGHGADAPTSATEAVDEDQAAAWLERYLRIVAASGLAERVYVWQLIAKGYGLVDPQDLCRRPAFAMLQRLASGA